jgi:hypothetical protein
MRPVGKSSPRAFLQRIISHALSHQLTPTSRHTLISSQAATCLRLASSIYDIHLLIHHSQHFQKIRKESRTSGGNANGDSPSPNKRANTNGVHKSTPRKSSKVQHGSFAQSQDDDDDEEMITPLKRKRTVKKEEGKENGGEPSAYLFKMENAGPDGVIDLETDQYVCHLAFC